MKTWRFCSIKNVEKKYFREICFNEVNDLGSEIESLTLLTSISSCDEDFMPAKLSPAGVPANEKKAKKRGI